MPFPGVYEKQFIKIHIINMVVDMEFLAAGHWKKYLVTPGGIDIRVFC